MDQRECEACGQQFTPTNAKQRACPPTAEDRQRQRQARSKCARKLANARHRGTTVRVGAVGLAYDCGHCGTHCVPGENVAPQATRFCGRRCKALWHKLNVEQPAVRRRSRRAAAEQRLERAARGARGTVTAWIAGACLTCGSHFVCRHHDAITCSEVCLKRYHNRRRRQANRRYLHTLKAAGCQDCKRRLPGPLLHFHHLDPATKRAPVARLVGLGRAALDAEIAKTVVLCQDCHTSRHASDDLVAA